MGAVVTLATRLVIQSCSSSWLCTSVIASITMVGSITFVIASRAAFSFVGRDLKRDRNVIGFHFSIPFVLALGF